MDEFDSYERRKAEIVTLAARVFGSEAKASSWLSKPKIRFGLHSPLDMLGTEDGCRIVNEMLLQLDNGLIH
jgi:putative toxin-antitoxin system antitoxin component (TIGR02293 family)